MATLTVAFYPCIECGKSAKCLEVRKRDSGDGVWKYRRYECANGHKFSTKETVYAAVRGHKPNLVQYKEKIND